MEEENKEQKFTDVATITLDFDALDVWRNPESDNLPVCSFISFYEACGLTSIMKKYSEENILTQFAPLDFIYCNFYTLQRIKNYIEDNWKTYSLDIKDNNHVFWDPKSQYGKEKHYPKKLKKRIHASIIMDFANFTPSLDDELPDNILVFRIYEKDEVTNGNN